MAKAEEKMSLFIWSFIMIEKFIIKKTITFLLSFIVYSSINAQVADTTLESLINNAIKLSPRISALQNKKEISKERIPQGSNLPDPMLTLGLANLPTNSFSFTQEPMTGKIIGLSQAVPFPGKLSAAEKVLAKDVDINQQEIDDAANEITNDVRKVYYDLRFTREAIRIAEKSKISLEQIAEVVRIRYSVSKASQQNFMQIEVELTKIKVRIEELKGKENSNLSILNSYLLREPFTKIVTKEIPPLPDQEFSISKLESLAKDSRPFLKGLELAKEKAMLMENLSKYEFYPNFNLSIQYSQRDKIASTNMQLNDFLSFMVGISLPFNFGGNKSAKVEETRLMQKMYGNQYDAAVQVLNKNFGMSVSKLNELKEREKLIREGLLPQAEQALKAAMANYQVGDIDFINVLDAQNKLYDFETNLYNIRTMYFKELSQLEFLTGTKVMNIKSDGVN